VEAVKPFPTDLEIVEAIQLLARANVLRQYEGSVFIDGRIARERTDMVEYMRQRSEEDLQRSLAKQLVGIITGSDGWHASNKPHTYYDQEEYRVTGWVIAYADTRRALEPKK
jgi:23S rRNA A2030 N6-methylase RlmJ